MLTAGSFEPAQRFEDFVAQAFSLGGPSGGRDGIDVQAVLFESADMSIGKIAAFPFEDGFVSGFRVSGGMSGGLRWSCRG